MLNSQIIDNLKDYTILNIMLRYTDKLFFGYIAIIFVEVA